MHVAFSVNGRRFDIDVEPRRTLADALREDCRLTGTHLGCEHGVCGACTVLVDGVAVRSCLMFAVQCDGAEIRTVEGLAAEDGTPHPLQEAFAAEHALQCGFCTPGFLMLAAGELAADPGLADDHERLRELLTSNLCRCTGYEAIRRAVIRAAQAG
jgi:aerobic carbon-monoxide dehydrogenase small subunit